MIEAAREPPTFLSSTLFVMEVDAQRLNRVLNTRLGQSVVVPPGTCDLGDALDD